jgi:hypothetical protein
MTSDRRPLDYLPFPVTLIMCLPMMSSTGHARSGRGEPAPSPAGRAYSDSYLNDNWILVR